MDLVEWGLGRSYLAVVREVPGTLQIEVPLWNSVDDKLSRGPTRSTVNPLAHVRIRVKCGRKTPAMGYNAKVHQERMKWKVGHRS